MKVFLIGFLNAIAAIGYVSVATYILKVRQSSCECARDWKQDFISIASVFLGIIAFYIAFICASGHHKAIFSKYPHLNTIVAVASAIYVVISFLYIKYLNKVDCVCSKDIQVILINIMYFVNGILLTYGLLTMILLFGGAATLYFLITSKKIKSRLYK